MAQGRRVYQLKLSLLGTDSLVWRLITVSANITLKQAHSVMQKAMGWNDSYGYCFEQDGRVFGQLPLDASCYVEDDSMFSLRYCLCEPGHDMSYRYGPWRMAIVLEAIEHLNGRFPWRVIDGAGVSPPDRLDLSAQAATLIDPRRVVTEGPAPNARKQHS